MVGLLEENLEKDIVMKEKLNENIVEQDMKVKENLIPCENNIVENSEKTVVLTTIEANTDKEDDTTILENVKQLLNEVLNLVETLSEREDNNEENSSDEETDEETKLKGILKHKRIYDSSNNRHVDFDLALKYIPFNPEKDYTIEIQFVDTIKKKVVSYAALFAQRKADEEAAAEAEAEAERAAAKAEEMAARAAAKAAAMAAAEAKANVEAAIVIAATDIKEIENKANSEESFIENAVDKENTIAEVKEVVKVEKDEEELGVEIDRMKKEAVAEPDSLGETSAEIKEVETKTEENANENTGVVADNTSMEAKEVALKAEDSSETEISIEMQPK